MPTCLINPAGVLTLTADTPATCTGWLLTTAAEYTTQPTLTDIFTMPISTDLAEMWGIGFTIPLIAYLTAWALGTVINFINEKG